MVENYHQRAQRYITDAKKKGMTVKAEGGELIAYPKDYKKLSLAKRLNNLIGGIFHKK